jgi:hypothetical protein
MYHNVSGVKQVTPGAGFTSCRIEPMRYPIVVAATVVAAALTVAPRPAHAEFGLGLFIGDPVGLTLKADLQRRTAVEVLIGEHGYHDENWGSFYGHVTFLVSPFVARGRSVIIPFRFGIGGAIYDEGNEFGDVNLAVRAPFQVAFRFRNPLELYFELSLLLTFLDGDDNEDLVDLDGGLGLRFYF